MPEVTVVICTHLEQRIEGLLRALESINAQTLCPGEVVIVVDGDPGLFRLLRARAGPERLVYLKERSGLSAARNAGIAVSTHDYIAFLDDDAVAEPSWLGRLVRHFDLADVVGASGLSIPEWEGVAPSWFPNELLWTVGCSYLGLPTDVRTVRNVYGGCACIRRQAFIAAGGFSVALGRRHTGLAGGEEADFSARVLRAIPSAKFVHDPTARIHHAVPTYRQRVTYVFRRCFAEGRSKALLHQRNGSQILSVEKRYLAHVVPEGIRRYLVNAARGDLGAVGRAAVLAIGVCLTLLGYVTDRIMTGKTSSQGPGDQSAAPPRETPAA